MRGDKGWGKSAGFRAVIRSGRGLKKPPPMPCQRITLNLVNKVGALCVGSGFPREDLHTADQGGLPVIRCSLKGFC